MENIAFSTKSMAPYIPILVISIGALMTATVTLALLHVMFLKYCKRRRQTTHTLSIEPVTIGLDNRILNTIPILFYSTKTCDLYKINQGDQCVICLNQLDKGDLVRWLPICGHVFHVPCLDNWFHAHSNCPICRSPVRANPLSVGTADETRFGTENSDHELSSYNAKGLSQLNLNIGRQVGVSDGGGCGRCLVRTRSGGLLSHSTKLVLPIEGLRTKDLIRAGLNRSLSMDRYCVVIDTKEQSATPTSSSRTDFVPSRLYQAPSNRHLDLMSCMALRSLHGLEVGNGGSLRSNGILPY